MKTRKGDIVISTTRPHRGAIAEIQTDKIIASTGFCVIREIDKKIDKQWLIYVLLSNIVLNQMLQRSSGGNYPAIIEDEIKQIYIPIVGIDKQKYMVNMLQDKLNNKEMVSNITSEILKRAKEKMFEYLNVSFEKYTPSLLNFSRLIEVKELGIYCNPHSAYLNKVFSILAENKLCVGHLEDFVEINPTTSKKELLEDSEVSFVPMTAVEEKNNEVVYEVKQFNEVKTGFTCFKKDDLLWAKITPCMQNGKSFIASDMPTDIGFGSTEFHVLRQKSDRIYMPYLWVILSDDHILEAAQGRVSGSAGQQRVPDTFLKKLPIVLPPVEMQKELADEVFEALQEAKRLRQKSEQEWQNAKIQFEKELLGEC